MSNPFTRFDWSFRSIGKIFGFFILGVIGLAIVAGILSFSIRTIVSPFSGNYRDVALNYGGGISMEKSMSFSQSSSRNIVPPIPGGEIVDLTAEDYEVHEYSASYRTRDKTEICATILDLKKDREIVFESANESERSCSFRFEVPNRRAEEILAILENLNPEDLNANIYTIQRAVEGTSDQLAILTKKLIQTEKTLGEAQIAYEELMELATRSRDVENLTQLITLKIDAIEQLAQKSILINGEIERVQRNRAEQLRRIANTTFRVNVYEEKFVDWRQIGNDWKQEIRNFVSNLNDLTQFVSVRLVSFVLYAAASLLYLAIAFGFLKLIWLIGKKVWKLGQR
ncbi:hypothetical protein KAI54_04280 [Candidatus Gracilibacteria bacterium]|nr:hypothetical protein [Candidatus Gracilibacteria bacterium]